MSVRATPRLLLRPLVAGDAERFFAINSDPVANRHNPHGPMDRATADRVFADLLAQWREPGFGHWAVAVIGRPEHVIGFGGIGPRRYDAAVRISLGYGFEPAAWGHGYATELARAARDFAFDELGLAVIHAMVYPGHAASIRVLEKIGMHHRGELVGGASLVYELRSPHASSG